jgi:arginyl-tRNA--protein-N-Asp/Glu arginylyltransferase
MTSRQIAFYASPPHPCGYLPARSAITVFADPSAPMDVASYDNLLEYGFRRSGQHVYVPRCPHCQACVAARIPVAAFHPNRTQRRTWRANAAITARSMKAGFQTEHFDLYQRYISTRHAGGGMDNPSPDKYLEFLTCDWCDTEFVEFRLGERLMAVAVLDVLPRGLSAVYTFFDPQLAAHSPGRHALLWSIAETRRRGLPWLYLGYWIQDCQKMQYKQEYRPIELLLDGHWQTFANDAPLPDADPQAPRPLDDNPG